MIREEGIPASLPTRAHDQSELMFMNLIIHSPELECVTTAWVGPGSSPLGPLTLRITNLQPSTIFLASGKETFQTQIHSSAFPRFRLRNGAT